MAANGNAQGGVVPGKDEYSRLANFLVLEAWRSGTDCVVIDARSIRTYFGLARLPDSRVKALQQAAKKAFPHQQRLWENPETNANVALYLSRVPLPRAAFEDVMSTTRRTEVLNLAVRTVAVDLPVLAGVNAALHLFATGKTSMPVRRAVAVKK